MGDTCEIERIDGGKYRFAISGRAANTTRLQRITWHQEELVDFVTWH